MKRFFAHPLPDHGRNILRRLGYGELRKRTGKQSFTRAMGGALFPRFHVYINETEQGLEIDLHLDQKEASYEGSHAHSGEYSGTHVTNELERIATFIESIQNATVETDENLPEKPSFWQILFG